MLAKVVERERQKQQLIGERRGFSKGFSRGFKQGIEQGIQQVIEEGIKQGVELGIKQGIQKNRIETAKTMLLERVELAAIIKYTGLSEAEVIHLRDELNPD